MSGRLQHQELEQADAAHELRDRRQARGRLAEFLVYGRQIRKDRRELARHGGGFPGGGAKEEFGALPGLAHATQQLFHAVHAPTLRASRGAPNGVRYARVVTNSPATSAAAVSAR